MMRLFISKHRSYWLLNLAALLVTEFAGAGIVHAMLVTNGGSSGPYLGQVALYPGLFLLAWAALTFLWFRMGWLGATADGFVI